MKFCNAALIFCIRAPFDWNLTFYAPTINWLFPRRLSFVGALIDKVLCFLVSLSNHQSTSIVPCLSFRFVLNEVSNYESKAPKSWHELLKAKFQLLFLKASKFWITISWLYQIISQCVIVFLLFSSFLIALCWVHTPAQQRRPLLSSCVIFLSWAVLPLTNTSSKCAFLF